ncbi:MAG: tRNA 4-thiouridine(8) synthase ThiI [candidate division WOR-3 bacterium]
MVKAIGLISGGLDSILAVRMILEQNIQVIGVCFTSPFFDNSQTVQEICKKLQIKLKIIKCGTDYIEIIKHPRYGYGKNLNPCIDCHAYMLKKARQVMTQENADFVFTGEVLNERPMSQNRQALSNIERLAGLTGRLLRPLSAKLLEITIPEQMNLVDRSKLGQISGRSRKPQLLLAKYYGIEEIPQPAGGCLLTDPNYSKRLKDALSHHEETFDDFELLKIGRHFRLPDGAKIIVGRNQSENERLLKLTNKADLIIEPSETTGPLVLVFNSKDREQAKNFAVGLCSYYSDKNNTNLVKVKVNSIIIEAHPISKKLIEQMRI